LRAPATPEAILDALDALQPQPAPPSAIEPATTDTTA